MAKHHPKATPPAPRDALPASGKRLLGDIRSLIGEARSQTAQAVNAGLVMLYWHIGARIRREVLGEKRAEYGKQIVSTLSRQLTTEYGKGFTAANLFHMARFAEAFPDQQIVYALSRQLTWTHFRRIIYLQEPLQREFYAEMCRVERWSTRTLEKKIRGMLYERTALSRKPAELARQELAALREEDKLTPDLALGPVQGDTEQ
jgi:hypothetical protein